MFRMKTALLVLSLCLYCSVPYAGEPQPVVVGKLMGQLGNQLFQIAVTTSLALDHGARAVFPDLLTSKSDNIPLNYAHVFSHLDTTLPTVPIYEYKEPHFHFQQIPYQPNMILCGYFQSEKYFKHHKEEILKLFAPSQEILSYLHAKYHEIITHPNTVAVHIRMYKDTKPEYHPFVGWNYVVKAIHQFDPDALVVIFSDQIDYCKRKLRKLSLKRQVIFIEGNRHFQDLYLMSLCKHNVISNSSFSWWAAYLNQNPHKVVIAPSPTRWFGPGLSYNNTQDILPEEWTILQ